MVVLYFALAFAITWGLAIPSLLAKYDVIAGPPEKFMPLVGLGAFGPMLAAMIASKVEGAGIKALFRRLVIRTSAKWFAIALVLPGATFAVTALAWNLLGHDEKLLYPPNAAPFAIAAIVFPFGEEVGWRGFALPRLLDRTGSPIASSAIVGVLWALWHVPMNVLQGAGMDMTLAFVPLMVAGSIFFTFLFQRSNGSLLVAILTHVGVHLNNPARASPERILPLVLETAGWCVLAIGLVAFDRSMRRSNT